MMNALSPPNGKSELANPEVVLKRPLRKLRFKHRFLDLAQQPFGYLFWLIESRRARVQDQIANIEASLP
jgi:hypothetical protein